MTLNVIPKPNTVEFYGGYVWLDENKVTYKTNEYYPDEYYCIEITDGETIITTKGEKGRYYAHLTLSQIEESGKAPICKIIDLPAFSYRGFMIDSARHMQTIDEIKAYITAAAKYKFNTFHWHLCDDQGWRIESEKYPELNVVGSYRNGWGFGSTNAVKYGGYYTKEEIRDVIAFCKEKFIDVVPEIDMPGHTSAIIATYPELSCRGQKIDVETKGGIFKNILCAGNEDVFSFCFGILDEVIDLFPGEFIHIGGDEAPKARWCNCPKCQERIKKEGLKNEEELQGWFANRIIGYLESKGKKAFAWNESLNSGILNNNTIICEWMDGKHKSEEYANAGGKIIVEDFYHYYLDYEYGMTPLKKTYEFNPLLEKLDYIGRQNVLGVESPIWTEYIENFDRMSYMCFPRLIAVAESGWTLNKYKDYKDFKARVKNEKDFLLSLGIKMADESVWDPDLSVKAKVMFDRLKSVLDPAMISATVFPNKDDD